MQAALNDLREAIQELASARPNDHNLREQALDNVDVAIGALVAPIRYNPEP